MVWSAEPNWRDWSRNVCFLVSFGVFSPCDGRNRVRHMSNIVQQRQSFLMIWWMMAMDCIWNKDLHHFLNFKKCGFNSY